MKAETTFREMAAVLSGDKDEPLFDVAQYKSAMNKWADGAMPRMPEGTNPIEMTKAPVACKNAHSDDTALHSVSGIKACKQGCNDNADKNPDFPRVFCLKRCANPNHKAHIPCKARRAYCQSNTGKADLHAMSDHTIFKLQNHNAEPPPKGFTIKTIAHRGKAKPTPPARRGLSSWFSFGDDSSVDKTEEEEEAMRRADSPRRATTAVGKNGKGANAAENADVLYASCKAACPSVPGVPRAEMEEALTCAALGVRGGGVAAQQKPVLKAGEFEFDPAKGAPAAASLGIASSIQCTDGKDMLTIKSSGVPPGGAKVGFFPLPKTATSNGNANQIKKQQWVWKIPKRPRIGDKPLPLPEGAIGFTLDGLPLFNSQESGVDSVAAKEVVDMSGGAPDKDGAYHIKNPTQSRYVKDDQRSPEGRSGRIGYALDGYPIHGPYDEHGQMPQDLDKCGGRLDTKLGYVYHVQFKPPYTIGCFHGVMAGNQLPEQVGGGKPPAAP
jgi:hypothetical protein